MTLELSRNRSTQRQPAATTGEPSLQPNALAGAESHLAEAHDIRRGIAQGAIANAADISAHSATSDQQAAQARMRRVIAASDARAQDDFHESMNSIGRKTIREQLDGGRQNATGVRHLTQGELPQMRSAERVKTPETAPEISKPLASERHAHAQPSGNAQSVVQVTTAPQTNSSGWIGAAVQETLDAGWGLARLHWDVGSWLFRKAGAGITAGARLGYRVATDPVGTAKEVIEGAQNVGSAVVKGLTWAGGKLKDGFEWIVENGASVVHEGLKIAGEIGAGIGEGFLAAGNAIVGLGKVITGQMSWAQLSQQVSIDFSKAGSHLAAAGRAVMSGISVVGGFLTDLSNSMGLTDIAFGLWKLTTAGPQFAFDLARVAFGQATLSEAFTRLGGNLSGAGQALVGGFKCLGEVTGVTDLCLAATHTFHGIAAYGRGEKQVATAHFAQAAVHGAIAAVSAGTIAFMVAATVGTAGAAAPTICGMVMGRTAFKVGAKEILGVAAKQFFKQGAEVVAKQVETKLAKEAFGVLSKEAGGKAVLEQLTKEATQQLGKTASKEKVTELVGQKAVNHLLSAVGVDGAHAGAKSLHTLMKREGVHVLTKETAHAVHRDAITEPLEKLLKQLKFSEHISDTTLDLLKTVRDKSPRKAGAALAEALGVSTKEGVEMAKQARKSLMKGRSDEAIKEELTSGITSHFKTRFAEQMEKPHKEHFRKILTGQLDEPWAKELSEGVEKRSKNLGIGKDDLVDDLVDAGWDGAKEGIEKTVHKFVKEGVDDAFKRFRQMKVRAGLGDADAPPELRAPEGLKSEELAKASGVPELKIAEETRQSAGDMAATTQYTETQGDDIVTVTLAFDNRDNRYHKVGEDRRSIKRDKDVKATAA